MKQKCKLTSEKWKNSLLVKKKSLVGEKELRIRDLFISHHFVEPHCDTSFVYSLILYSVTYPSLSKY